MIKLTDILNELEVNRPKSNLDILKKMVEWNDDFEGTFIESYINHDTYEQFIQEWEDSEDKEFIDLAKIYYKWMQNNSIWHTYAKDSQDDEWENMPKAYKNIITYGLAYEDVRIILHNF